MNSTHAELKAKNTERSKIEAQTAEYLSRGKSIVLVDSNFRGLPQNLTQKDVHELTWKRRQADAG